MTVVSDKHRFIYIRVGKTGSTSMEKALSRYGNTSTRYAYQGHDRATLIRRYEPYWDQCFKFAFTRHPCERFISLYEMRTKKNRIPGNMNQFIENGHHMWMAEHGRKLYTEGEECLVDKVFKYEEMDSAVSEISDYIGERIDLPMLNCNWRTNRTGWQERLPIEIVQKLWVDMPQEWEGYAPFSK